MFYKNVIISFFMLITTVVFSQDKHTLQSINSQVWEPFTRAYETLDANLFARIHSENLIRVGANNKQVKGYEIYIEGYKSRWENLNRTQTISFRFFERLHAKNNGSERGVYKLTIHPNTEYEQSYYGKFHVILVKEHDTWKILVDYDSNENNTINETTYQNAFAMDDFDKY